MGNKAQPVALPARMHLDSTGFEDMNVAVLEFPFTMELYAFSQTMQRILRQEQPVRAPYRKFNHALLACVPTLTHGFEHYYDRISGTSRYRALAVGRPGDSLRLPTTAQIHALIKDWLSAWTRPWREEKSEEARSACERFLSAIAAHPSQWNWESRAPHAMINDLNAAYGLGYAAIPSVLATLLHERSCIIHGGHGEQHITWRKVVGSTSSRTGLFLVSNPFYSWCTDQYGKRKEGYFAYRLDFHVHTQAGRFNADGKLKPWVFTHLRCQRYAHESLKKSNYGRDVSVLVGVKQSRLSDVGVDSTLVRLPLSHRADEDTVWNNDVATYLAAFKARELDQPSSIKQNPLNYGNLQNDADWDRDEYYIVHAEGYQYGSPDTPYKHKHAVKTGFSLRERGDIVAGVLEHFGGVLIPDSPMTCDRPTPYGVKTPLAMRDVTYTVMPSKTNEHYVRDALKRAYQGIPVYVSILWRERSTRDAIVQELSTLFHGNDESPAQVHISDIYIDDATLLEPLETNRGSRSFSDQRKKAHAAKCSAWLDFLQRAIPRGTGYQFAMIELGSAKQKGVIPQQSIYAAVREACALKGISSQMIRSVNPKIQKDDKTQNDAVTPTYSSSDTGRVENAVRDLIFRQSALLLGTPSEVYVKAGIPESIAHQMDVIALCRRQTVASNGDVHYALAVRMSAEGATDVLLPSHTDWMSYAAAGPIIGGIFSEARSDQWIKGKRVHSHIKLTNSKLIHFAATMMTTMLRRPTLIVVEATGWRNERSEEGMIWPQLKNEYLYDLREVLDLSHVPGHHTQYARNHPRVSNIVGIVRIRTDNEVPQYISNRSTWSGDGEARDFTRLSGFYDISVPGLPHYFSVGRLPKTQKNQDLKEKRELYKLDHVISTRGSQHDAYGMDIAFKHQQMVELVPFFVRPDLEDDGLVLCRALHYLRTSPAWKGGNISRPYPMHLGDTLIDDQLCIVGVDTV